LTHSKLQWALYSPEMLSRGPRPLTKNNSVSCPSHPHEVTRVLNTISEILAASAEIVRRDHERGNSRLPTATLDRVSALSESLWEDVILLPLSAIPSLYKPLIIYGLILADIQHILSSSDLVEISDDSDTIDRRLDDFQLQFQEALDLLKGPADERSPPNSTHFFPNSHHIIISGGNFTASTSNPVVHDPVVREQSHKILQVIYIQCVVLFA